MGDMMGLLGWSVSPFAAFLVLILVIANFFTVNTAQVAIIQRFGRFSPRRQSGLELEMATH